MSISRTPDVTNIKDFSYGAETLFNAVTTTGTSSIITIEGNASAFVSVDTGGNNNTIFKLEGTVDGTKWWTLRGLDYESGLIDGQFQGDRSIHYNISGLYQVRGNITAIAGTATVKMRYQASEVSIGSPQVAISNTSSFPTLFKIEGYGNPYILEPNGDGSIAIGDGTDVLAINTDGSINTVATGGTVNVNINQMDSFTHNFFTNTNANILGTTYFIGSSYNYMGIQIVATGFTGTANFLYKTVTGAWQTLPVYQPGVNTAYTTYAFTGNTGTFAFYTYLPANTYINTQITGYAGTGTASAIADFSVRPYELFQNTGLSTNRVNLTTSTGTNLYLAQSTPSNDTISAFAGTQVLAESLIYNGTSAVWERPRSAATDGQSAVGVPAAGNMVFNGSTWDRLRTVSIADGVATGILANGNYLYDSSGAVWNRLRGANGNLDTADGTRFPGSGLMAYNGSTWERIRTVAGVADGATTGIQAKGNYGWNGAGWDRVRTNNVHKYQEYLSLTNGQHLEIWTPAAGKKFRLMNVLFSSNYATGAKVTLRDAVGGTTAGASNLATFNFNAKDTSSFQFGPNGYLSYQANNRLAVFNDSGATVSVWLTFIGTEE